MNNAQQIELLTDYIDSVREAILSHSDQWPESWDGFELRWLAEWAFSYEASYVNRPEHKKRKREFQNEFVTRNLY